MAKKSWTEKLNVESTFTIKTIEKKFADMPAGCTMLIVSPPIMDAYIRQIPFGEEVDLKTIRLDLVINYGAEKTCPVTTGIYLRIVAEAAYEAYQNGTPLQSITPFWRVIHSQMKVAGKLACGKDFIEWQREQEGVNQ